MRGLNLVPVCPLLDRQLCIPQQCRVRPEINEEQRKLAHNAKCVFKKRGKTAKTRAVNKSVGTMKRTNRCARGKSADNDTSRKSEVYIILSVSNC